MGDNLDLKELISNYTKHWQWFLLMVVTMLILSVIYVRYKTPEYLVAAKIQIQEEDNGGVQIFGDSDLFSFGSQNVLDEIELIKSRSNFIEIVQELKLNVGMKLMGNLKEKPLYGKQPLIINFIAEDSVIEKTTYDFYIRLDSDTSYSYLEEEEGKASKYDFGKKISTPIGNIVLTPNPDFFGEYQGDKIHITVQPVETVADSFRYRVNVINEDDKSSIVSLSLQDPVPERAKQVLDRLVFLYNDNAIRDKKIVADRTRDFINDRISEISLSLSDVDDSAENLRTERGIADLASETSINLNVGAENRQKLNNVQNELNIASNMRDYVDQKAGFEVLPSNLGFSDPSIANTTAQYNQLVQERKRLLKSSNEKNPVVVNLDGQLRDLKRNLKTSLNSTVDNLTLTMNSLSGQQAVINSRIYSAPIKERALRDITRKQQTTESLYLYLLQKREEAQIAVASTNPKCKVVDMAYLVSRIPVSPRTKMIYLMAVVLGIAIPFSIIYAQDILDNKVYNMRTLEKITKDVPVLGELPKLTRRQLKQLITDDRSVLSESLRILRTNLDYLIKTNRPEGKKNNVVFVTSSISGEGKTFVSSNLAMILASAGKKVVLLGADIRNPKIRDFFKQDKGKFLSKSVGDHGDGKKRVLGFTDYLFSDDRDLEALKRKISLNNIELDIIYSGRIPPNPAELLLSPKVSKVMTELSRDYDYVIVDTAPLMVVTDTLLISEYADHLIYVTRARVTEKKAIEFPIKLQEEKKIKGLAFVVNDVSGANLGYGGLYGYGYGQTKKRWWKF